MTTPPRLQSIFLVANNIDVQAAFYESVLGLSPKFRDGQRWIQYDAGGARFALSSLEEAHPATAGLIPVYEVDHFDNVAERVVQSGGQALDRRDMGDHGAVLSLRDPEGNIFQMFRRKPHPSESQCS